MERETGIEPATNSLEGCDSTTELLPPFLTLPSSHLTRPSSIRCHRPLGFGAQPSLKSRPYDAWLAMSEAARAFRLAAAFEVLRPP